MKKISSLLVMLSAVLALQAQTQSLGFQLGFTEPVLRDNTTTGKNKLSNTTITNGFKAGIVYDATLVKGFGMNVALNYSFSADAGKWASEDSKYKAKQIKKTYLSHTIELPIEWQYKFRIATDTWLIAYTGPVLQYNFSLIQNTYHSDPVKGEWQVKQNHYEYDGDGDGVRDYSPFNIQWGIGAGFQYKNYFIRGGYNFGIYNHFRDNYNNLSSYTNRARYDEWNIRLGIYFLNF